MSNNENNFNPDCAEDERLMRPTPEASDNAIPSAQAKAELREKHREDKRSLFISELIERSTNRIAGIFKESWTAVKSRHPEDSVAVRLMTFHRVTADTVGSMKPALMDLVMSQINSTILPLLSDEERKELDRTNTDDVLHDIINRGFADYPDFKDQLDAVDLLLLEPDESNAAWQLFRACMNRGLIAKSYTLDELEALKTEDELREVQ